MIPTPRDVMPFVALFNESPGWWLFFREPDYAYDTAYYVPAEGEYVRSTPAQAPKSLSWQTPPTWQNPPPPEGDFAARFRAAFGVA